MVTIMHASSDDDNRHGARGNQADEARRRAAAEMAAAREKAAADKVASQRAAARLAETVSRAGGR